MLFIDALADYLADRGFGTIGEDLFLWFAPAAPGTSITVSTYQGGSADPKFNLDTVRFQLRVRGTDTEEVTSTVNDLYLALHSLEGIDLGGFWLIDCQALQPAPTYLGRDASGRDDFSINFSATVKRPDAGNRL